MAYHVPLEKLISALGRNNANAGGAYLERNEEQSLIRGEALISSLADIEKIVVGVSPAARRSWCAISARFVLHPMVRQGFATQDGKGEIVIGVAMMLIGENSRTVVDRVKAKLADIQRTLPPGVRVEPLYDRTELVRRTIGHGQAQPPRRRAAGDRRPASPSGQPERRRDGLAGDPAFDARGICRHGAGEYLREIS